MKSYMCTAFLKNLQKYTNDPEIPATHLNLSMFQWKISRVATKSQTAAVDIRLLKTYFYMQTSHIIPLC